MVRDIPKVALAALGVALIRLACLDSFDRSHELASRLVGPEVVASHPFPPGIDNVTCSGYWGTTGFLCDKEKLMVLSKADQRNNTLIMNATDSLFKNTKTLIDTILVKHPPELCHRELHRIVKLRTLFNSSELAKKTKNSGRCWNYMQAARNSSLCSICSSKNSISITSSKMIVDVSSCRDMMNACRDHLDDLGHVWSFLNSELFSRLRFGSRRGIGAYQLLASRYSRLPGFDRYIVDNIDTVLRGSASCSSDSDVKRACVHLLSLREEPALGKIIMFLTDELLIDSELTKGAPIGNWRSLQLASALKEGGYGDAFTDVTFLSDVLADVTVSGQSPSWTPMNLSLSFP